MEWIFIYISTSVLMIYAAVGIFIFMGFYIPVVNPSMKTQGDKIGELKFISIIIPFRNEEKNLPALIESLKKLHYSKENFEIIFVNDHSTDKGPQLIRQSGLENFRLIDSKEEGKKATIAFGIEQSIGEWIATTDADCTLPAFWLDEINKATECTMILGPVQLHPVNNLIHHLQEIEFAALQSISASTAHWKMPLMSNGANLAYKKTEFKEISLKKEIASGDDIFLLEDFQKRKLPITFLWNSVSIVKTASASTFKELIQQKVRWASKSKYYNNYTNTGLGILIALINMVVLGNYINFLLFNSTGNYSLMMLLSKMVVDLIIIIPYLILIKKPYLIFILPAFVLVYPFYFIYVLILSIRGKFIWKERSYRA